MRFECSGSLMPAFPPHHPIQVSVDSRQRSTEVARFDHLAPVSDRLFRVDRIFPTCLGALVIDPTIVRGLVRSFTQPRTALRLPIFRFLHQRHFQGSRRISNNTYHIACMVEPWFLFRIRSEPRHATHRLIAAVRRLWRSRSSRSFST